ncbi:MAG TPA: hypothetical protein VGC97_05680 [Pyrinomonadaceae bacterium]|jgi:hypothetical protein
MNTKVKISEKCSKLLLGCLFLLLLLCLSCGFTPQNDALPKSLPLSKTNDVSQNSEPVLIVQKFIQYVSENKLNEANGLIKTPTEIPETGNQKKEAPVKLNWAEVFKERNYSLEKIVNTDISENEAKVKTILNYDTDPRVKIGADFTLKKNNNQWLIYDIDFIVDKSVYQ